jgi:hypothetical protein
MRHLRGRGCRKLWRLHAGHFHHHHVTNQAIASMPSTPRPTGAEGRGITAPECLQVLHFQEDTFRDTGSTHHVSTSTPVPPPLPTHTSKDVTQLGWHVIAECRCPQLMNRCNMATFGHTVMIMPCHATSDAAVAAAPAVLLCPDDHVIQTYHHRPVSPQQLLHTQPTCRHAPAGLLVAPPASSLAGSTAVAAPTPRTPVACCCCLRPLT